MVRMIAEFASAAIFFILAILTAAYPQWIEGIFGIDPDRASGVLEWTIVAALGALAVLSASLGTRTAVLRARSSPA